MSLLLPETHTFSEDEWGRLVFDFVAEFREALTSLGIGGDDELVLAEGSFDLETEVAADEVGAIAQALQGVDWSMRLAQALSARMHSARPYWTEEIELVPIVLGPVLVDVSRGSWLFRQRVRREGVLAATGDVEAAARQADILQIQRETAQLQLEAARAQRDAAIQAGALQVKAAKLTTRPAGAPPKNSKATVPTTDPTIERRRTLLPPWLAKLPERHVGALVAAWASARAVDHALRAAIIAQRDPGRRIAPSRSRSACPSGRAQCAESWKYHRGVIGTRRR